jgi:valyl-tRNA synthetase
LWNATRFALRYLEDFVPTPTLLDDLMSSGKLANRDKFMISRLMKGVEAVNDNFANYKFGDAQQAAYQLWMDDLCAVYLELIKPIMNDTSEEKKDARWAAQATLWLSLEIGVRLLHPMMPFVTEELWQRLPGRGSLGESETPTIMLAAYPECNNDYKDDGVESAMATIMDIIAACRSLRASYNINNKVLTHFFIKTMDAEDIVKAQVDDIVTLGKASLVDVNIDEDAIPESVGASVVNDTLTVLIDLKGMVDYKKEISRLNKEKQKAKGPLQQLETKMAAGGYAEKVPEKLQKQNVEKQESLKKKVTDIDEAIAKFEKLMSLEE